MLQRRFLSVMRLLFYAQGKWSKTILRNKQAFSRNLEMFEFEFRDHNVNDFRRW